jgi:hypothetical protein
MNILDAPVSRFIKLTEQAINNSEYTIEIEEKILSLVLKLKFAQGLHLKSVLDLNEILEFSSDPDHYCEYLTIALSNFLERKTSQFSY